MTDQPPTEPVCLCGHPMRQHHEDVCLTECGCNDGREPETAGDLPDRLEAALTARFTELGNPFSRMRIAFQGPDGWPASKEVGPHDVALVLRELLATAPAVLPPPADRAAVLREAAAAIEAEQAREEATAWAQSDEPDPEIEVEGGAVRAMAGLLRRMAAEAQQPADRGAEEDIEVRVARHLDDWEMQSSRTRADRQTLAREVIAIVRAEPQPDFQDRGDAARRAAGIDGTAGDAQDLPHAFVLDEPTGGCLLCGLAPSYRKHGAEAQQQPATETLPPVVEYRIETRNGDDWMCLGVPRDLDIARRINADYRRGYPEAVVRILECTRTAIVVEEYGATPEQQPAAADTSEETCDGCGHTPHQADQCQSFTFNERCECDEPIAVDRPSLLQACECGGSIPHPDCPVHTDQRAVCICGHTRGEHARISGRLLCDVCDPDSTDNLTCTGFEAL